MEPITVKARLDFKTYYRIALLVYFTPRKLISLLVVFAGMNVFLFIDHGYDLGTEIGIIIAVLVIYGIVMPAIIKRNMRTSPVLKEGITYHITNETVEGIAPGTTNKNNWSLIGKVMEKDDYFLLLNSASQFRYLPKNGFASDADILRFKEIVKENRVKAYFK